jgi:hypothetical protein
MRAYNRSDITNCFNDSYYPHSRTKGGKTIRRKVSLKSFYDT